MPIDSRKLSPTTAAQHVIEAFGDEVPVVDGGACEIGIESTVVAIADGKITLLRPGMISLSHTGEAATPAPNAAHPAPGMHPRHYSPRTKLIIVPNGKELPDRHGAFVWRKKSGLTSRSVRMPFHPTAYAQKFYDVLHELDREGWPWIAVEAVPETPEWAGVRDRLHRASS